MYSIWHADFNSNLSSHDLLPRLIVINAMNYSGLFKVCEQVMAATPSLFLVDTINMRVDLSLLCEPIDNVRVNV